MLPTLLFAEFFLEAAAPAQPIVRAVPFEAPGKSGPKTLLFKAAQRSIDIRSLLGSPKPDAKDIAKKDEERLLEEKMEAEERVNLQDEEVRLRLRSRRQRRGLRLSHAMPAMVRTRTMWSG